MLKRKYFLKYSQWLPELEQTSPQSLKIFVGNKIDLREEYLEKIKDPKKAPIRKEVARKIIEDEMKAKYVQCSALTREGLNEVFNEAMRLAISNKMPKMKKKGDGKKDCQLI